MKMRLFILLTFFCISVISFPLASRFEYRNSDVNFLDYPAGPKRKKAFIAYFKPIIEETNKALLNDRVKLIGLSKKSKLNIREQRWLRHISAYYKITLDINNRVYWSNLLNKIDSIPTSLALAQGAKESGWGTSRFAQEGNNYFGQWCYQKGCGLVPKRRNSNAYHEVAKYESSKDSVTAYFKNINNNPAYQNLRNIRAKLRNTKQVITGHQLAYGLSKYSERGNLYVKEIQALIRNNYLENPG